MKRRGITGIIISVPTRIQSSMGRHNRVTHNGVLCIIINLGYSVHRGSVGWMAMLRCDWCLVREVQPFCTIGVCPLVPHYLSRKWTILCVCLMSGSRFRSPYLDSSYSFGLAVLILATYGASSFSSRCCRFGSWCAILFRGRERRRWFTVLWFEYASPGRCGVFVLLLFR